MSSCCGCDHGFYTLQPATRGVTWDGADIFFPAADRAVAIASRFLFFAPGSIALAFTIDAVILDGIAWHFSLDLIQTPTYPAGIYSFRQEIDTDADTTEQGIQGTWTIAP